MGISSIGKWVFKIFFPFLDDKDIKNFGLPMNTPLSVVTGKAVSIEMTIRRFCTGIYRITHNSVLVGQTKHVINIVNKDGRGRINRGT